MKPVTQEEVTGCAIASTAAISGISYRKAKRVANSLGINANDSALWSETEYIRTLLRHLGFKTGQGEIRFRNWRSLPDCALLATQWHLEKGQPVWHWVVFVREKSLEYVLDSKKSLKSNVRTDFGRIKPKWFIRVYAGR